MCQENFNKRFNVTVMYNGGGSVEYKNVELVVCEPNYLRVRDDDGNEHYFAGVVSISVNESKK